MWFFFGTPYSTVLTINVSTQVEPCFICKKQVVQHINPFLWKIHGVNYRITAQLVANKTEARHWTCAERLSNAGSVHQWWGDAGDSYMLVSIFIHVRSLGCISYGTPCINDCEDLGALDIEIMQVKVLSKVIKNRIRNEWRHLYCLGAKGKIINHWTISMFPAPINQLNCTNNSCLFHSSLI